MQVIKCISCDLLLQDRDLSKGYRAYCPHCGSQVKDNVLLSISGQIALTLAALLLLIPAQVFALVSIDLFGVTLSTTATSGAWAMSASYPFVSALVVFCVAVAPLLYLVAILAAHYFLYQQQAKALSYATKTLSFLKHWVMVDVMLVSLAVACFKVMDFSSVEIGSGLVCFILLQIILTMLLSHISPKHFWDEFNLRHNILPPELGSLNVQHIVSCHHCQLVQDIDNGHCHNCGEKLSARRNQSLQKTWAILISACIFLVPANVYSISVLVSNGMEMEDTIFSGVAALIKQGMYGIAAIIFTASIIVPVAKILGLLYILLCIQFKVETGRKFRMKLYRFVLAIGKWSMMDLCVIAIMVSLIDRGNFLDFTPGPGAIAFGLVVILTMISAENLDPRLIWDDYE